MSPFLLCRGVAVPWRCRSGCVVHYASVTLRVLHCVALRVLCCVAVVCGCVAWRLRFVVLRAVALRSRRSCYVSGGFSLPRLAAPCCSVLRRASPCCSVSPAEPLRTGSVLRRAQNRHFCALFGFGTPIFCTFEHKIDNFVSEWAIFLRFLVVLTQKWGFCAREA